MSGADEADDIDEVYEEDRADRVDGNEGTEGADGPREQLELEKEKSRLFGGPYLPQVL